MLATVIVGFIQSVGAVAPGGVALTKFVSAAWVSCCSAAFRSVASERQSAQVCE